MELGRVAVSRPPEQEHAAPLQLGRSIALRHRRGFFEVLSDGGDGSEKPMRRQPDLSPQWMQKPGHAPGFCFVGCLDVALLGPREMSDVSPQSGANADIGQIGVIRMSTRPVLRTVFASA